MLFIKVILPVVSLLLLGGFIGLSCILNHGIPASYSAFSSVWEEDPPKLNTWSIVTFMAAMFIVPPMIEAGDGNPLQFLGFFAPLYLIVVSLTPKWETVSRQRRIHMVGAIICAVLAFLWLLIIRHHWWVVGVCALACFIAGCKTRTMPRSAVFWGELVMFASVYLSLIIGG